MMSTKKTRTKAKEPKLPPPDMTWVTQILTDWQKHEAERVTAMVRAPHECGIGENPHPKNTVDCMVVTRNRAGEIISRVAWSTPGVIDSVAQAVADMSRALTLAQNDAAQAACKLAMVRHGKPKPRRKARK